MRRLIYSLATLLTIANATMAVAEQPTTLREVQTRMYWNTNHAKSFDARPLYGNIDNVNVDIYIFEDDKWSKYNSSTYYFNEFGHVYRTESKYQDGSEYRLEATYNDRGDVTRSVSYDNGIMRDSTETIYDYENGKYIEYEFDGEDRLQYTCEYSHYDNGEWNVKVITYSNGNTASYITTPREYGTTINYMRNDELVSYQHINTSVIDGVSIETSYNSTYGTTDIKIYNKEGQLIEERVEYTNNRYTNYKYEYNEAGLISLITTYENSELAYVELYLYDEKYNLIEIDKVDRYSNIIYTYTMSYDDMGNVIEQHENPDSLDRDKLVIYKINYRK